MRILTKSFGGQARLSSVRPHYRSTWKPFPLYKPFLVFPGISLTQLYSPLKPSLSCPGSGIERPPSNPPNPEVIAAGSFPTWLYSNLTNTQVGSLRRQYTNLRLQVALWPGAREEGSKNNNFIYVAARSATIPRGRKRTAIWRM